MLRELLAAASPDWDTIRKLVRASNMQVPLEAVRFHSDARTLTHVWVLATLDLKDKDGQHVVRPGSERLLDVFKKIIEHETEGRVAVHDEFRVPPYNAQTVCETVDRIYREDAAALGLPPHSVIADVTSGTVAMTAGMTLACALFDRPLEYTAADSDPVRGLPMDRPQPVGLDIASDALRRLVLQYLSQSDDER